MAHPAVSRELREGDLRDQLGRHPVRPARLGPWARRVGGVLRSSRAELRCHIGHHGARRSRCRPCLCRRARRPRAGRGAGRRRRGSLARLGDPADDHELLPQCALHLDPVARASAAVGCVGALGDDPLLPRLAHRTVERLAGADDVLGDVNRRGVRVGQQRLQPLLALDVAMGCQVLAVDFEQVEGEQVEHGRLPALQRVPQRGEAGIAVRRPSPRSPRRSGWAAGRARRPHRQSAGTSPSSRGRSG